jgi:hypothetical protein
VSFQFIKKKATFKNVLKFKKPEVSMDIAVINSNKKGACGITADETCAESAAPFQGQELGPTIDSFGAGTSSWF